MYMSPVLIRTYTVRTKYHGVPPIINIVPLYNWVYAMNYYNVRYNKAIYNHWIGLLTGLPLEL